MTQSELNQWQRAEAVIKQHTEKFRPDLAVLLGSGLAAAVDPGCLIARIPYQEIPGLPVPSVTGHAGELLISEIGGWNVWFFSGRYHLYEGYSAAEVVAHRRWLAA